MRGEMLNRLRFRSQRLDELTSKEDEIQRDLRGDDPLVDADHAVFKGFGNAPDPPDIAAVEIGREPELGVVGKLYGFVLGLETKHWRNRPEGFLAEDHHVGCGSGQNRRFVERAPKRMAMTADRDTKGRPL